MEPASMGATLLRVTATAPASAPGGSASALIVGREECGNDLSVVVFFVLACALSWSYWVPLVISGATVERGDGWPTHVAGLLGPLPAALALVAVLAMQAAPGAADLLQFSGTDATVVALAAVLVLTGFGEEAGWWAMRWRTCSAVTGRCAPRSERTEGCAISPSRPSR
jgi:hypothetical protein